MMFLQYFGMGAFLPILSLYLKDYLEFSPEQIGYVLAMLPVAAFVSPFIAAHVADRYMSSERLMALCHLAAGSFMLLLTFQRDWWLFLLNYLLFAVVFAPTSALSNAVTFHHVRDAKRGFGGVRVWGTAGWIAVAWVFGVMWLREGVGDVASGKLPYALHMAGGSFIALGLFMLTFPKATAGDEARPRLAFREALAVLRRWPLWLLCALAFAGAVSNIFYIQWASPYLRQIGFGEGEILPVLSVGQLSEILGMALLGRFLGRFGFKPVMVVGLVALALRMVLFAFVPTQSVAVAGVFLHGISWSFYFTAAYIYVDQHCSRQERAAVQQLYHMMLSAFGQLTGSLAAGYWAAYAAAGDGIDFTTFWILPLIVAAGVLAVFLAAFPSKGGL